MGGRGRAGGERMGRREEAGKAGLWKALENLWNSVRIPPRSAGHALMGVMHACGYAFIYLFLYKGIL